MEKTKLSVIVPVYNMERYVEACIDSLLAQTYSGLQIVLVNDCSTDNSLEILKEYQRQYTDRIVVIDSKENLRQGGARNLGIRSTNSEYIGFVDADDFVHPMMYEILMKEAEANCPDVVFCGYKAVSDNATYETLPENLKQLYVNSEDVLHQELTDKDRMEIMASHEYGSVCVGGVYRRSLIEREDLYFPEHLAYEDNYWVYALQMNMQKVTIVSKPLYFYRQQEGSTIHKKNAPHHYDRIEIGNRLLDYVKERGLFERYRDILEYLYIEVFTMNTFSILLKSFDAPDEKTIEQVKVALKKRFPNWKRNRFYAEKFSTKKKLKFNLMMHLPVRIYKRLLG